MAQYYSRLYIKVSSPEVWLKCSSRNISKAEEVLANIGTSYGSYDVFDLSLKAERKEVTFILDADGGGWREQVLKSFVISLAKKAKDDILIIADTHNIDTDPDLYCVYYLGEEVRTKKILDSEGEKMYHDTSISDVPGWLSHENFKVSRKEEAHLLKFGIVYYEGFYLNISEKSSLHEKAHLRETSFMKRPEAIEKCSLGEKVTLVHAKTSEDVFRLEVMSEHGSLGYLPSEISEKIAPGLIHHSLEYTACISELVPLSKRNKNAKSSIVEVEITGQFGDIQIVDEAPKDIQELNQNKADEKIAETKSGKTDITKFSYSYIDSVPASFYEGVFIEKEFVVNPDSTVNVSANGNTFGITIKTEKKMQTLLKKYKKSVLGKNVGRPLYDPLDVVKGKYEDAGSDEYGRPLYTVSSDAKILDNEQIAHRTLIFAAINNLLNDKSVASCIVDAAPKKKNGTFALRRVTQIASLFCMEADASMYTLCAVATKDTALTIEVRQIATVDLQKTEADVITISDLFREKNL